MIKLLILNKKIIANTLYNKVSRSSIYVGIVSQIVLIGFNRIKSVFRWFYASIIIIFLSYILSIYNILIDRVKIWFNYVQKLGKYIILKFMEITGPLEKVTLDYLWLLFILICLFISLIFIYFILKYLILKYKIYKENKEQFKKELLDELSKIDNEIINEIEKLLGNLNKEKQKKEIKIIYIKGVNYNITEVVKRLKNLKFNDISKNNNK